MHLRLWLPLTIKNIVFISSISCDSSTLETNTLALTQGSNLKSIQRGVFCVRICQIYVYIFFQSAVAYWDFRGGYFNNRIPTFQPQIALSLIWLYEIHDGQRSFWSFHLTFTKYKICGVRILGPKLELQIEVHTETPLALASIWSSLQSLSGNNDIFSLQLFGINRLNKYMLGYKTDKKS